MAQYDIYLENDSGGHVVRVEVIENNSVPKQTGNYYFSDNKLSKSCVTCILLEMTESLHENKNITVNFHNKQDRAEIYKNFIQQVDEQLDPQAALDPLFQGSSLHAPIIVSMRKACQAIIKPKTFATIYEEPVFLTVASKPTIYDEPVAFIDAENSYQLSGGLRPRPRTPLTNMWNKINRISPTFFQRKSSPIFDDQERELLLRFD